MSKLKAGPHLGLSVLGGGGSLLEAVLEAAGEGLHVPVHVAHRIIRARGTPKGQRRKKKKNRKRSKCQHTSKSINLGQLGTAAEQREPQQVKLKT